VAPSGGGGGGAGRFCSGMGVGGDGAGPFEGIMGGGTDCTDPFEGSMDIEGVVGLPGFSSATVTSELLFTSLPWS
jgi:hypothetical protein